MKFWKRIFIYSMAWFLLVFNGTGIFIIENIHKRSLDRNIKTYLDEHQNFSKILTLNQDSIQTEESKEYKNKTDEKGLKDWLGIIINNYILNDITEPKYLEIYNINNNLIFSSSELELNVHRLEITEAKTNERSFIIRKVKDKHYIFIGSKLNLQADEYKLIVVNDIEFIYKERIENYKLFLELDCFVFLIFALGMYLISKQITKPIVKLSEASQEISKGNYKKRVEIKNEKDEIGTLAINFNAMIKATENNIMELKNLNNDKQRFIDSLTHEIKTPLTSIIGYSDLLIKGNINENTRFKALNYINSEAKRLEKISFTLLKLILIKQEDLNVESISLKECISCASEVLAYKIANKNINLKVNVKNKNIIGDKQLIVVLLTNLLDNAIKASKDSGIIEFKGDFQGECGQYVLIVKDYGVGIPKEDLNKIKEPFYMVDKARDRGKSGVGLGLAICDEICDVLKIKLDIDSKVNEGTKIIMMFSEENVLS